MLRTIVDYRMGGQPQYVVTDKEELMRLPDTVQKCIVFLGIDDTDTATGGEFIHYGGTAFLVSLPSKIPDRRFVFLVAAKHAAEKTDHIRFYIRFNTKDGKSDKAIIEAAKDRWLYHPTDKGVDVAIMPWVPPREADYVAIPVEMFLDRAKLERKGIGVGDEVYLTGLFSHHKGNDKNYPIVRTGNVAMLPAERVATKGGWHTPEIEAYLIEARSLGGLSGSPVFAQRSIRVLAIEETGRIPLAAGAIFFLGLVHGHWEWTDPTNKDPWASREHGKINVGIAMVVPAHHILEALYQPVLKELRAQAEMRHRTQGPPQLYVALDSMGGASTAVDRLGGSASTVLGEFPFKKA